MFKTFQVGFSEKQRPAWMSGELVRQWASEYPAIIDADDLRLALNQPHYHFYEWVAAIALYQQGYYSLIEQYVYKNHLRKEQVLLEKVGTEGLAFLRARQASRVQVPDLFVYNEHEFGFVEVKSPTDRLRESQAQYFQELERHFKTQVLICLVVKEPVLKSVWRLFASPARHGNDHHPHNHHDNRQ